MDIQVELELSEQTFISRDYHILMQTINVMHQHEEDWDAIDEPLDWHAGTNNEGYMTTSS